MQERGRVPLVVCITRLVAQKGLHLINYAVKHVKVLVRLDFLNVVLHASLYWYSDFFFDCSQEACLFNIDLHV